VNCKLAMKYSLSLIYAVSAPHISLGKTHTMFGNTKFESTAAGAGAGLIPQAVADLFKLIGTSQEAKKSESFTVLMSYMEVYNEQVRVCTMRPICDQCIPYPVSRIPFFTTHIP
jgi:hypothetical protein